MNTQDRHEQFTELVARYYNQLYAYIFAVVRNREDARDLLQSVCLVLWRKFDLFQPGTDFFAWARQTSRLVVTGFLRHRRMLSNCIDEELVDAIAETFLEGRNDATDGYLTALRQCRNKLKPTDEELLRLRYVEELGSREIADRLGRPQQGICNSLKRIRRSLFECIQMEVARQDRSRATESL
jgi:RNA polymerase sigma-70 factor (ECF subfamily)